MTLWIEYGTAVVVGGLLAGGFFGGLWYTVRDLHGSGQLALRLGGSLFLRLAGALLGFWAVLEWGGTAHLAFAMGGWLFVRIWVVRRVTGRLEATPVAEEVES
ncbi:MAG TPA: ATP synthase subunit I [Myxococcales bacterium LLY-WYZ-16_1]|nr:ATP synthase subunit I [Myxococcales bacterium LLY-WYZ-16_1]